MLKIIFIGLCMVIILFIIIEAIRIINKQRIRIIQQNGIQENINIEINGIKQYLQIRGEDKLNPIILWLHGGPGFPLTYLSYYYQKALEKHYTIVCFEQRGCGRTYYQNNREEVSVDELIDDIDGIANYLCNRFNQKKIIIMAQSWGTLVGLKYLNTKPEKIAAYIGIGQVTLFKQGKIYAAKQAMLRSNAKDTLLLKQYIESFKKTKDIDDINIKELEQMIMISLKYLKGSKELSSIKQMFFAITSPEFSWIDLKWFLIASNSKRIMKLQKQLLEYMYFAFDVDELGKDYQVPICFIQGENDWITPTNMVKSYYDTIFSSFKKLVVIDKVGHTPFLDDPKQFCNEVRQFLVEKSTI